MSPTVIIDSFPESALKYRDTHAIVAVDVIRASTTIATAVNLGMSIYPVSSTDEAFILAKTLRNPLLVGELGGKTPYGFDMTNSPAEVALLKEPERPIVFITSSGTRLIINSVGAEAVYIGCFRNISSLVERLRGSHERVAVLGAGTRGQFRREDRIGCTMIAQGLIEAGFEPENGTTARCLADQQTGDLDVIRRGRSAAYLKRSDQMKDLEFVLSHIDDLVTVPRIVNGKTVLISECIK